MSPTCSNGSSTVWPWNTCGHVPAGSTTKLWRKSPLRSSAITSTLWPFMPPENRSNATPAHCFTKRGDTLPCLTRTLGRWLLQGLDAIGNFAFLGNEVVKNLADIGPKRSCPQQMHPRSPVFRRLQEAVMTLSCGVWSIGAGVAPGHPARSRPETKSSSTACLGSLSPAAWTPLLDRALLAEVSNWTLLRQCSAEFCLAERSSSSSPIRESLPWPSDAGRAPAFRSPNFVLEC